MIEVALRAHAELGEAPTWDVRTRTLLWVDILGSTVHRFDPARGADAVIELPQHVGAAKPRAEADGLVLNLRDGVALLDADGTRRWLAYWAREGVRGNDAAVDPAGRLWAGTMRDDKATGGGWLVRVAPDGQATVVLNDVTISNGIGWSPKAAVMYYVDSPTRRVDAFDYDLDSGEVHGRRPLCAVEDTEGVPDGLCVDADGGVWVAVNGGGAVRRYTPTGQLDREVTLPVSQPSACCFGGPDLTDLYVTTTREGMTEPQLAAEPLAGSLLVLPDAGVGLPTTSFAG
ncbi:SMP-30/gluconolactonase/LRE family protein [Gandjariella thermophila]|uniref:Calcium-binding protein n=1 Tax=Gandjariella thermophila TaxID=1931992 RepID=A0A4D4JD57_9PSEU|nr:SMP-30/gluconolactonase/LRE family protein [Gandjariella thermophila]GDY33332.1 calcium-binding protein [Gandjariella thermophila]